VPRNVTEPQRLEKLPPAQRASNATGGQDHWYLLASYLAKDLSVLDVGAGDGRGLALLRSGETTRVVGTDPAPVDRMHVLDLPIEDFRDRSFDAVTAMDVLEHVEEDTEFLSQLHRVARRFVFLSTPNWNTWKCQNPFHVREYTPEELAALIEPYEAVLWTCGKNREEEPPFRIPNLGDALATYGVLLRGAECTDDQWAAIQDFPRVSPRLPRDLARLSRTAEEWTTYFQRLVEGLAPLPAAAALVQDVSETLLLAPDEVPAVPNDAVKTLRFGRAGPHQQAVLLTWLLNTFALAPAGPYLSQPKPKEPA